VTYVIKWVEEVQKISYGFDDFCEDTGERVVGMD
jgi:hypothetical protein